MVKNRVVYKTGIFTDYAGRQRQYVVAAVSEYVPQGAVTTIDENCDVYSNEVVKKLSLGFAICNPEDKWNEELGKTIALGKAVKRPSRMMWVSHRGMINTAVVDALMEQEMVFFENNPGSVITGYDAAAAKFKKNTLH